MKASLWNKKPKSWLWLAFALPVACILVLMMIAGCVPFGNKSMLYSDCYHQYFPFFKAFRQALLNGDGLLWTWSVGMGLDYLGLISYYLASPFYLLSVFVPEGGLLAYFSLLLPIRLGLASLFFALFLYKLFGEDSPVTALFGCFYGMCAWALGYQWNVMWLDTFLLLPLVMLGEISLLRDKKFFLYTITLFLSIFANYYIGLFTCIFVFLCFFCYEICRCRSIGRFFMDFLRIAFFSLLAIGMTAILELPALAALQTTQSSVNTFPSSFFDFNMADEDTWLGLLTAMYQVAANMAGGIAPNFKDADAYPNIYCGLCTMVFAFLFLTAPEVKLRDKLCSLALLVFFILSFIVRQLDYIWHGMHFTNMIPYRFSFLYSFVLLYMAYRVWLLRGSLRLWQVAVALMLAVATCLFSTSVYDEVFIAYNTVFLALYLLVLAWNLWEARRAQAPEPEQEPRQPGEELTLEVLDAAFVPEPELLPAPDESAPKRTNFAFTVAMPVVMVLEIIMNTVNFGVNFAFTNISAYPRGTTGAASVIKVMREHEDELFYRAETTHSQTLNDGALNGYYGVSGFTSSANVAVTEFMKDLGYSAKNTYNRYCFEESSPVSNLFLNLKYMIERGDRKSGVEENPYFTVLNSYSGSSVLENNAWLPLGFLAEPELAALDFSVGNEDFTFQNLLFTAATGVEEDVWRSVPSSWLEITASGVDITSSTGTGYCKYSSSGGGTLTYTYTAAYSGYLCFDINMPKRNSYSVYLNGTLLYTESITLEQMIAACQVEAGDVVEVRITVKSDESSAMTIVGATLVDDVFWSGYDILNASTLQLTDFSTTYLRGTIDCNRDGYLYTSIPQNGNWYALVDGVETEIVLTGGAMAGVYLTEGEHVVEFYYRNAAFELGWKVSLGCAVAFAAVSCAVYLPRRRKMQNRGVS